MIRMTELTFASDEEAHNIPGFLLWQVSKLWQRHLAHALKDLRLTSTQAVLLGNIVRANQANTHVTQASLSNSTKIDRMTISTVLRTLQKKGLISRASNSRTYQLTATQEGRRVTQHVLQKFMQTHQKFFAPINKDIHQYVQSLQALIKANDIKEV